MVKKVLTVYENSTKIESSIIQKGDENMQGKLILLMKEKNITNKELASKLGISEKQLGLKLKGTTDFKSSEMFKISKIFHRNIDEIFLPSMYEKRTSNN